MKILEKSTMKNGVEIQLEDWNGKLAIGAYPICVNGNRIIKHGKAFRLTISENQCMGYTNSDVKEDFEKLKIGEKQFRDVSEFFQNGKKDSIMLGIA